MRNRGQEKGTPPPVMTKESGRVVGDSREGDAQPSPTQPPEGLKLDTGLAEPQTLSC